MLSIELEGRVFGGGALEVLPGDMKSVRIPKISYFENSEIIFNQLDQKFRKNDSIFDIVKWVDEQIKKHTDSEVNFDLTYSAWKEVNQNRYKKR